MRDPDVDVVHICTPNHLHLPLAEARARAGKHVICEKPLALDAAGARRLVDAAAESGLSGRRAVRLPLLPDGARGARARRQRADRRDPPAARQLPAGLAPAPRRRQLARRRRGSAAPSRAFADIGSHWCDLAEFVSGQRITRRRARTAHRGARAHRAPQAASAFAPARDGGEARAVTTEDAAVVQFETDARRARLGGRQPDLGRTQEPALVRARRRRGGARLRPGAARRRSGVGRREAVTIVRRDPATLSPAGRAPRVRFPAGHPQGYADCFDAFVADVYDGVRDAARRPTGLPTFADGLRAARDHRRGARVVARGALGRRGGARAGGRA